MAKEVKEVKPKAKAEEATVDKAVSKVVKKDSPVAKAGKRSAKVLKEAEEVKSKEERKLTKETADKPKIVVKPARSKVERRSKNYRTSVKQIEKGKDYSINEAVALSKKTSTVKFDATVEMHINLAVDPRHSDQNIRDNLVLPNGIGKKVKVAVLTDNIEPAKEAGADIAGNEEIFNLLDKGSINFDVLISEPTQMSKLGKYARLLGPRGLMPNPKSGTVTTDIVKAVSEAKTGKVEYRVDSTGIVHLGVGKVSFSEDNLQENIQAVIESIKHNKPQSVKGSYIKSMHLTTSMGPSIKVDLVSIN